MIFENALKKAYDVEQSKNPDFRGLGEIELRAASLAWNIVAIALQSEEKTLDDLVFINNNNFRISIPLTKKEKKQAAHDKAKTNDVNVEKEQTAAI